MSLSLCRALERASSFIATLLIAALLSPDSMADMATGSKTVDGPYPALTLLASPGVVEVERTDRRQRIQLGRGVYVAAAEGPLELRIGRVDYDSPISLDQIIKTSEGEIVRVLPPNTVSDWQGLGNFLRIEVANHSNRVVRSRLIDVCLNSIARQRVSDRGPVNPSFPPRCYSNPFTKRMVWGIDEGWAVPVIDPFVGGPTVKLADGTYTIRYEIRHQYRHLFSIAPHAGSALVTLTVVTDSVSCGGCRDGLRRHHGPTDGSLEGPDDEDPAAETPVIETPPPEELPDLIAVPAWGIGLAHKAGRDYLLFGATVWNGGGSPLVLEGFRREDSDAMDAFQYFYEGLEAIGRIPVGQFDYDNRRGHQHWHLEQFVSYSLLRAEESLRVRSRKQSFCLAPTDAIDLYLPNAQWNPDQLALESACGVRDSIWLRETLPVGWGDTYTQVLPGQSFDITALPNGAYLIEVRANPQGRLAEQHLGNNIKLREIVLSGRPGARTVEVSPWRAVDSEVSHRP